MHLNIIGYLALFSHRCVASDHEPRTHLLFKNKLAAFSSAGRPGYHQRPGSYNVPSFELQALSTGQNNPLLELVRDFALGKKNNAGNSESLQDFDADLAAEIEEALLSADMVESNGNGKVTFDKDVTTMEITEKIVRPPVQNEAPQSVPEIPPHTALAQVLANQYGIDLSSVSASSVAPGSKITAEDVEFHAWKISQPPCTPEALELAHTLGLDLNDLYDGEELQLSDVQLFQENMRSLQMTSQIKKGATSVSKKAMKQSALDKRMEQNIGKLSEKAMKLAGTVAGSIVQQVQLQSQMGVLGDINGSKVTSDITSVEDFDKSLASEIQAALSSANLIDKVKYGDAAETASTRPTMEVLEDNNGSKVTSDITSVEDFDESLASEIQAALSSANLIDKVEYGDTAETASTRPTIEELQSMTCVQLKEELRLRGLKVSGKKSDLVDRLFDADDTDDFINDPDSNCGKSETPLFFADSG